MTIENHQAPFVKEVALKLLLAMCTGQQSLSISNEDLRKLYVIAARFVKIGNEFKL